MLEKLLVTLLKTKVRGTELATAKKGDVLDVAKFGGGRVLGTRGYFTVSYVVEVPRGT